MMNLFTNETANLNRRQILKGGLALALCLSPLPAWGRYNQKGQDVRALSLYNTHTGETIRKVAYWEQGKYINDALLEINYLLRDHRSDKVFEMDPHAIDILFALQKQFDCQCPIEIISGYRSPETNLKLSKQSNGVAKRSYHMQGKAIDLRMPDVALKSLKKAAIDLRRGGVGYYPKSNFVHVDTGPVRNW
jgi:uncharacterized protein YcbK (DUF882 family)